MYRIDFILLLLSAIFFGGCSAMKVESKALTQLKKTWVTPTPSSCKKFGGYYGEEYKVCEANLEQGKSICQANNAFLPSIDDYVAMSLSCGALKVRVKDEFESSRDPNYESKPNKRINANNKSYQKCIEALGFYTFGDYYSSSLQDTEVAETICYNNVCSRYTHSINNPTAYKGFMLYYAEITEHESEVKNFIACKR